MHMPRLTSHLQSYFRHGSMDTLHSYRMIGRFLLAILAGNMLLQSTIVSLQVVQSVASDDPTAGSSSWLGGLLLLCHEMWIVASAVGGVAGFYAAWRFHIPCATVCLRAWMTLALVQVAQYLTLCAMLASPQHEADDGKLNATLAWESAVLIAIEGLFVVFVHGYIIVLREWQRQCSSDDGEGICLVQLHPVQVPEDKAASMYGTAVVHSSTCSL